MNGHTNGDAVQQIIISLDAKGNLSVSAPQNKLIAYGMLTAAQTVIAGLPVQQSAIVPISKFIPPPRQ